MGPRHAATSRSDSYRDRIDGSPPENGPDPAFSTTGSVQPRIVLLGDGALLTFDLDAATGGSPISADDDTRSG